MHKKQENEEKYNKQKNNNTRGKETKHKTKGNKTQPKQLSLKSTAIMCYGAKNYSPNGPMAHFCCLQAEGEETRFTGGNKPDIKPLGERSRLTHLAGLRVEK